MCIVRTHPQEKRKEPLDYFSFLWLSNHCGLISLVFEHTLGGSSSNYERKQGLFSSTSYEFINKPWNPNPRPSLPRPVLPQVPYLREGTAPSATRSCRPGSGGWPRHRPLPLHCQPIHHRGLSSLTSLRAPECGHSSPSAPRPPEAKLSPPLEGCSHLAASCLLLILTLRLLCELQGKSDQVTLPQASP